MQTLKGNLKTFERKQIVVSILALLVFLGSSIIINTIQLSGRAEQTAKLITRMVQIEDFREVGTTLELARLDYFQTIHYQSDEHRKSFSLPARAGITANSSFFHFLSTEKTTVNVRDLGIADVSDKIVFEYSRFLFVPYAFALWLILNIVSIPQTRFMKRKIIEQYQADLKIQKKLAQSEISKKVRHNIRTPLSALLRLSSDFSEMKQEKRILFQGIINQIRNLISELDPHDANAPVADTSENLWNTLRLSVSENRLAHESDKIRFTCELEESISSAKVQFQPHELRSILANLITNAKEAIPDSGEIILLARDAGTSVIIEVRDNGVGIPEENLSQVTLMGFSAGKSGGTGLGLYHANKCMAAWRGKLQIQSSPRATVVTLALPIIDREPWHVARLKLQANDRVVVIDDQVSIHHLWKLRLSELEFKGELITYFGDEPIEVMISCVGSRTHFFVDYNFGESIEITGLDIIKRIPAVHDRYLVTGSFDECSVQHGCIDLDVGLIPKSTLATLPIIV